MSNSAFYVHLEDPVREVPPLDLQSKHHRVQPRPLEKRLEAAAQLRNSLEDHKVQGLAFRLAHVALLADNHHRQTTQNWLKARDRVSQDMDQHVRRRTAQISKRLRSLNEHNQEVKARKEEVKQEKFLRKLTHLHQAKTMSTISQFWGKI
ncbi:hypothetical protein KR009_012016 [Drosophila setifemur]|nr:hypothetical protein KR009_012016 [Drosophila setifemur]